MGGVVAGVMDGVMEGGRAAVMAPRHAAGAVSSLATRSSPFPMPEPSFAETSRPWDAVRAEPSTVTGVAFSSEAPPPWPEPPELSSPEPGDPLAVLRDWERLRRLEREQRGE
jgi:hypothetical protein